MIQQGQPTGGVRAMLAFHTQGNRIVSKLSTVKKSYGLAPCVWRRLRAKHPGMDLVVYGRDGHAIGTAYLHRYESVVSLPEGMDFRAVSWRQTIDRTEPTEMGMLGPTPIPIGATRWG